MRLAKPATNLIQRYRMSYFVSEAHLSCLQLTLYWGNLHRSPDLQPLATSLKRGTHGVNIDILRWPALIFYVHGEDGRSSTCCCSSAAMSISRACCRAESKL